MRLVFQSLEGRRLMAIQYSNRPDEDLLIPQQPPLHRGAYSDVYLLAQDRVLAKAIRPISFPKDYYRRMFHNSQAKREYNGAKMLRGVQVSAPNPIGFATIINPFSPFESIFFMEYKADYQPLSYYLAQPVPLEERRDIIARVARDVARMVNHHLHFTDLNLHNILQKRGAAPCWIDTDVRFISSRNKLRARTTHRLVTFRDHPASVQRLTSGDWSYFMQTLRQATKSIEIAQIKGL